MVHENPTPMKTIRLLAVALVAALTSSTLTASYPTVDVGRHKAVANQVLARFKPGVDAAAQASLMAVQRARISQRFTSVGGLVIIEFLPGPQLNSVVPPANNPAGDGKALLDRIKNLQRTGAFEYVEPDYLQTASLEPNDSAYTDGTLWGLKNTGAAGGVAGADIAAAAAWSITTGNASVIVAVVDTGVNYLHQDLASQMWVNPGEIAGNGLDDDNDGYVDNVYGINAVTNGGDPMDDNQHGSHVSGTIGALANGGGPIVGVAWNVRIMACKFLDANGSGATSDAIECIDFVVAEKLRTGAGTRIILSNSWGGGPFEQSLEDAIAATRSNNMLFVAAAGNDTNNNDASPSYPASYAVDNILSVAAVDRTNNIARFSNFGAQSVHLGAPGVAIYSSTHTSPTSYATLSGTSMAAPHVSGAAVLLWAQFPTATYSDIRQRLLVGTVPIPALSGKTSTGGRLNVHNSLTVAPDNQLELAVSSDSGLQVVSGQTAKIFVRVSDLFFVNNATVTGTLSYGGGLTFLDNGVAPDAAAGDGIYSASLIAPSNQSSFALTVNATAPGKTAANAVVTFAVRQAPANDNFANRQAITIVPAILTASTLDATGEALEPAHAGAGGGRSLWWTWTAPANGVYTLSTSGSTFDTVLGVYVGNSVSTLTLIGDNDDAGFDYSSEVVFSASAGVAYHFAVDGFSGDVGSVQLNFSANPLMTNNNFANPTAINGVNLTVTGHNVGATGEFAEPAHAGYPASYSVWWTWTAPSSGSVTFSTAGSSFDTVLAVYTGNVYGALTSIAFNDNVSTSPGASILTSEVTFTAQAGVAYRIAIDGIDDVVTGASGVGNILLHIGRSPANDNFASRVTLTGDLAEAFVQTVGATRENFETSPVGSPVSRSVWWTWTAPRTGKATITTDGSSFDTVLAVYTGNTLSTLTEVASNDDRVNLKIRTSLVSFGTVGGTTYQIQLDGFPTPSPNARALAGRALLTLTMDGRSRLSLPDYRPGGVTSLKLLGEPDRAYVLSSSTDFVSWGPIATNTVVSREVLFTEPTPVVSRRFYRAQPASLLGQE